ncbi:hypothetical protein Tco_0046351 [Tanacetum coccineum]
MNVPEKIKSSCEDHPDLELKDLSSHLEYSFLEGDDKLPVIIAKNLKDEDKNATTNRPDQGIRGISLLTRQRRFYRRFIQIFQIARPMTPLLKNETPLSSRMNASKHLKPTNKKLTQAPILAATHWDLPYRNHVGCNDLLLEHA